VLRFPRSTVAVVAAMVVAGGAVTASATGGGQSQGGAATTTPIQHLVVIFQENVSFDHYFGTYPTALNSAGEPSFTAAHGTPAVNGFTGGLLSANPNSANPQRLDRSQAVTCDMGHDYTPEQSAADHGAMDKFVENTSSSTGPTLGACLGGAPTPGNMAVMDYYDGNTVTAMWNYAQRFAMSDNSFGTGYGPSTPGALNLVTGNPFGAACGPQDGVFGTQPACSSISATATPGTVQPQGPGTVYGDPDPNFDVCSHGGTTAVGGRNIGDELSSAGASWGWFQGGFASPGYVPGTPSSDNLNTVCTSSHTNVSGATVKDYSAHHEPFQYYSSTANPRHLPPLSVANIGHADQANHQYDLADFWAAADNGGLPAVSFLKAAKYQDGHAGYSDPLDEQTFLVNTINHLQKLPSWESTAVVIAYDDSDGWYDHVMGPLLVQSQTSLDTLTGDGQCGSNAARVPQSSGGAAEQARCGYGPRLPLLVISPFARQNAVDHTLTDQSSIIRFVEDNWSLPRIGSGSADALAGTLNGLFDFTTPRDGRLLLDPSTGEPASGS
jgi:phospholipase C